MTGTVPRSQTWTVAPVDVSSPEAASLLRDYFIDVSDRYFQLHLGRRSTPAEIEEGLADHPSDDLTPPTGVFLVARHGDDPAGCAGLRVLDRRTVELTRMFVRHARRGTGGGARLLAAAEEAARDLGAARIVLDTRLDLVEARALYVRHGYAEVPAHNDRRYAEIWYGKELGPARSSPR
ncbi:GNAT family N-acetyltransferase [Micromonospora sp. 15K316]|uniref:GNAT family N-acetyltransferase n=1 Tax=Micromonospora sp. 15K316 TaxID=2530376 RepID=UPI00104AF11C|nr:GNAT family N-acetyltransferase [Micromonospora sp. 15K316]TDC39405.1 GNAT family N-acetyltransferase [Micromonospora sp. 15K316]